MSFGKVMLFICCSFLFATAPAFSVCAQEEAQVESIENAADQQEHKRKKLGFQVVGFLAIYTFIMWRVKRKIWRNVDKNEP